MSEEGTIANPQLTLRPSGLLVPNLPEETAAKPPEPKWYPAPRRTRPMSAFDRLHWNDALKPIRIKCFMMIAAAKREIQRKSAPAVSYRR